MYSVFCFITVATCAGLKRPIFTGLLNLIVIDQTNGGALGATLDTNEMASVILIDTKRVKIENSIGNLLFRDAVVTNG